MLIALVTILLLTGLIFGRKTLANLVNGNVHFPTELVADELIMDDGMKFTVFRDLRVGDKVDNKYKPAVFVVRFKFRNLGVEANKRLSLIPVPFLMGMEGFRKRSGPIASIVKNGTVAMKSPY